MRDIKFRGRAYNGGYVYGYLYEDDAGYVIMCNKGGTAIRLDDENPCICQLVGYDADGNEIYERDMLKDNYGEVFTAEMAVSLENEHNYTEACDVGDTIFGYRRWNDGNN